MDLENYFFDTYALYEIVEGNPNYARFTKGVGLVTTRLNLMEFYYAMLKEYGRETADKYYGFFVEYAVEVDDETIKQAMVFKWLNKSKRLSYVDCVGYMLAKKRGIKFLTGDKEFEDMEQVKFVK